MSFYHYTSEVNLERIKMSGALKPSTPHQFPGNLGNGVYVTTLGPSTDEERLRETLFKNGRGYSVMEKMQAYVELNRNLIQSNYAVKSYRGRESYVIKTDSPVELNKFMLSSGKRASSFSYGYRGSSYSSDSCSDYDDDSDDYY